jgi:hyperosmotically inducible protein
MGMRRTKISIGLILIALLAMAACGPNPGGETAGGYLDDATITAKVKGAISLDSRLSGLDIRVETEKDVVQLSGFVDSQEQVTEASRVASGVAGVKSVHNSLIVRQRGA